MSKWYEVTVTRISVVAVEVEDDESEIYAMECAISELPINNGDTTATCKAVHDVDVPSLLRHADQKSTLEDA